MAQAVAIPIGRARGIGYRDARRGEWWDRVSGRLCYDGRDLWIVPGRASRRRVELEAVPEELADLLPYHGDAHHTSEYELGTLGRRERLGRLLILRRTTLGGETLDHPFETPPLLDCWPIGGGELYRIHGGSFTVGPFGIEG